MSRSARKSRVRSLPSRPNRTPQSEKTIRSSTSIPSHIESHWPMPRRSLASRVTRPRLRNRCIAGHLDSHRSDARIWHRLRLRAVEYDRVRHAGAGAAHTQGTGLYNLMRNIGASIGISTMSYLLVRNSAITQSALVEHITPYRQGGRRYAPQLNIVPLSGRAAFAQTVTAQAEAVAFIDSFKLMMLVSFLAIPLVILVQPPSRQLGNQGPVSD